MTELRESTMRKLVVPAVLVLLAAAAFFAWPAREAAVPPALAPVAEMTPSAVMQPAALPSAPNAVPDTERTALPAREASATKNSGDASTLEHTLLRGSVVDTDGVPVPDIDVHFKRSGDPATLGAGRDGASGYARGDNTFECNRALAPGEYDVDVRRREVVRPTRVTITGDRKEQILEVVVAARDLAATISGVLVDEAGEPVHGAEVTSTVSESGWTNRTDRDGRFWVTRPKQGGPNQVALYFEQRGFDPLTTDAFAWGRHELRLVLLRSLEVEVVVSAAGALVEEFALRIFPQGSDLNPADFETRAWGKHPGGRVRVRGVRRGKHLVVVEPADSSLALSEFVPLEVVGPDATRVAVFLPPVVTRTLQVRQADGTPLVNANVQLVDPLGARTRVRVWPIEQWGRSTGGYKAVLLQSVTTDARGETVLRGPADRTLAVFLPGPGNAPLWQGDVRLGGDAPFVITVAAAARFVGSVGPRELLQEWRELAGLPVFGALDEGQRRLAPTVVLTRDEGGTRARHPEQPVPLDDDGAFEIGGAAPGTWRLQVSWWRQIGGGRRVGDGVEADAVELRSGETTRLDLDLSHLLPGDLDGVVLRNGKPMADSQVVLRSIAGGPGRAHDRGRTELAQTDGEGRFHARLQPGEYSLTAGILRQDGAHSLLADGTVRVLRGERTTRTFHVQSGSVRVRLVDPAGVPASGVTVELRDAAGVPRQVLAPTEADGWTSGDVEAEAFTVHVLPRRLQDLRARQEVWRAEPNNRDPFVTVRLRLGSVTARVGETTTIELRLPPEFER